MATVHLVKTPHGWVHHQAIPQDDGEVGFGEWLRRAREARGLSLADITRETKIPLRNLEALEHGNLGRLPTFYQRAEVRAIARVVGVDEGLAIGRLDSATAPVEPALRPRVAPPVRQLTLPAILGALALGVLLWTSGGGLSGWLAQPQDGQPDPPSATATRVPSVTLASQTSGAAVAEVSPAVTTAVAVPVEAAIAPPVPPAAAATDPPTAPDLKAATGSVTELVVRTEPPGAQVTVNGIGWGVSPVTIRHVPPGSKHIRVTRQGFAATERVLTLGGGQQQAVDLRLRAVE